MRLSEPELTQFHEQGFLFLPRLFAGEEVECLLRDIPALQSRQTDGNLQEKTGAARQLYTSHRDSSAFKALCGHPRILEGIHQIVGNDVYVWHSKINMKESFEGTVWLWHQDYGYWFHDGVDPKLISCLVYLDDATHENGCMMVIPGTHAIGRVEHFPDETTTSYKQWTIPIPVLREITCNRSVLSLPGEAGSAVIFHCNLIHGSNHNMSPMPRRSVIFAYNDVDNRPRPVPNPRPDYVVSRRYDVVRLEDEDSLLTLART